jgi:hypothetical protein
MGKKIKNYTIKLILYVLAASLGALISDLHHYSCISGGFKDIPQIKLTAMILNVLLQGLIAWRAYIDDSYGKLSEEEKTHF